MKSNETTFLKRIGLAWLEDTIFDLTRKHIVIVAGTGLSMVLGFIDGLPLTYIFLGAVATFALVSHGLLRFNEWRFQINPEHKLDFLRPEVMQVADRQTHEVNAIKLGFNLINKAIFPLEVEIEEIRTSFEGRVNSSAPRRITDIKKVGMGDRLSVGHDAIDLSGIDLNNFAGEGQLEFRVNYGAIGKRYYTFSRRLILEILFKNRKIESMSFRDAPEEF